MRGLARRFPRAGLPLRVRLTLAFAGATAILLGAVGSFIFLEVKSGLDASLDASLRGRAREFARLADGQAGLARLRRALTVEGEPAQLLDARGHVLAASPLGAGRPLFTGERLWRALRGEVRRERHEATRQLGRPVAGRRAVVVSTSMVQRERALESLAGVLLLGGPLILLLASSAGYLVAAGALRPVERMRRRAGEISAATPDARLPLPDARDEVRRLGETLNAMLARLEAAAEGERRFLATASHELRTPLAILRAEIDLALHEQSDESELRAALRSIREEAERLGRLADDLLVIARGDAGGLSLHARPLDLGAVVRDVARRFERLRAGAVRCEVPDGLEVTADSLRLEQALGNLVDNALRHGAPPVVLAATRRGSEVEVHVRDAGPGFPAARAEEPFVRGEGGQAGGFGLGLAVVEDIAQAHGGRAGAVSTGAGADVWLTLPARN